MEKAAVVALRDALLQDGENRALTIAFDNGIVLSQSSDVIIWNDDKEIIIGFTADSNSGSFLAGLPIQIITSTYEHIQFIISNHNVDNLEAVIDSLGSVSDKVSSNKELIMNWYRKVYSHNYELSTKHYDPVDIIRD